MALCEVVYADVLLPMLDEVQIGKSDWQVRRNLPPPASTTPPPLLGPEDVALMTWP
jgi:hypothetical protein